jgi:hypothetical protein
MPKQVDEVFAKLAADLPPTVALGQIEDPDEQARAALSFLVERVLRDEFTNSPPSPCDPSTCPNCGTPVTSTRSPYCGDACREMSAFIRQFRSYVVVAQNSPPLAECSCREEEGSGTPMEAESSSPPPNSKLQIPNSKLPEGPLFIRERQIAMGETLWHVLGGGRPRRQSLALPRTRATVMKREEGKCQVCGAPATTFDHIGSG